MATPPERLLRRLEWKLGRRLDGRLQGAYRTVWRGAGIDFTDLRVYLPEDDVRHIDWNVTADDVLNRVRAVLPVPDAPLQRMAIR